MTDQVIETRQDCFNPATMRLKLFGPEVLRGEGRHPSSK